MMMQLGCDGLFVGSGIFKSSNPKKMAKAIVEAALHYDNPSVLAKCSEDLGQAMESLEMDRIEQKYAERGW
jgi:pyridoxal 5'-phosphate synthase pdxS subunit